MKKILLLITILFGQVVFSQIIDYEVSKIKTPEIDVISKAKIGSPVYTYEDMQYKEGVELINVPAFKISTLKYNLPNGYQLPLKEIDKGIRYYYNEKLIINGWSDTYFGVAIDQNNKTYATYKSKMYLNKKEVDGFNVEIVKYINPECNSCIRHEIIYNGKQGSVLTFNYKEYVGDLIRPAFFQELKYDLNDGKVIGFKNLEIEIVETNNLGITYKVLSHL